jgi:RNA polymerase sigma-70 factor (ECF subfamily)
LGANHVSGPQNSSATKPPRPEDGHPDDTTHDPAKLARWTELHERIDSLPAELREVFDLRWYQELTHDEAATVLGVSSKTISRRWRDARVLVHDLLEDGEV